MPAFKDLVGQRFGRLLVVSHGPSQAQSGRPRRQFNCVCDCGRPHTVPANRLSSGDTRSCGCLGREAAARNGAKSKGTKRSKPSPTRLPDGVAAMNALITGYRHGARRRGLEYSLTRDEFYTLTQGICMYCKIPPYQGKHNHYGTPYTYNGIDRVDPTIGYVLSNCVSCCGRCNKAKSDMSPAEFRAWVDRLFAARGSWTNL